MSKRTTPVIAFGMLKTRFPSLSLYRFSLLYCYFFAEKRFFFGAALLLFVHLGDWDSWMKTREQKNRDFIAPARTPCVALITDLGLVIAQKEFIVIAPLLSRVVLDCLFTRTRLI
ncbi:hypothetical protein CDAR_10911 [Caerostris darwini]|uniref:Uncharacterized protein n=1 Tax=Caerostris darwini TaxID=1538125 RepID=A0AAV4W9E3_9ARAC|nr:hypothetical protein CDAR_10911 [Caerostris darwini]